MTVKHYNRSKMRLQDNYKQKLTDPRLSNSPSRITEMKH